MALKDFFIRKKSEKNKEELKISKAEKKDLKDNRASKVRSEVGFEDSYRILKSPHITEKSSSLAENNQYSFRVFKTAQKNKIKKAVERIFGVNVLKVSIVNLPEKSKKIGRRIGYKSGYKKAIVKIKQGQKIEILPR